MPYDALSVPPGMAEAAGSRRYRGFDGVESSASRRVSVNRAERVPVAALIAPHGVIMNPDFHPFFQVAIVRWMRDENGDGAAAPERAGRIRPRKTLDFRFCKRDPVLRGARPVVAERT